MVTCSVIGCTRVARSRGKCSMHYLRDRRNGVIEGATRHEKKLKFIRDCTQSTTDTCITLIGNKEEYPTIGIDHKYIKIGWIVLERIKGLRPSGMVMRHLCGNSRCCNPRHLEWGTELENMADKKTHGTEYDRSGEANPKAKLTLSQVEEIRKRYIKGKEFPHPGSSKYLSREFKVTRTHILYIVEGKSWK